MGNSVFKRKIYEEIREWKDKYSEKYALLIKGARRVGKSTIVEEFARNEFKITSGNSRLFNLNFQ